MNPSARVQSLDAVKALHAALSRFSPDGLAALGAAEIEIRRTLDLLQNQLKHWLRQTDKRREDLNRARSDLSYARALNKGERGGTVEPEIAVRKAEKRLKEAEEKVAVVKRWLVQLPQDINEYEGPARRLASIFDADLKHGLAILDSKIASLEAYMAVPAPEPTDTPRGTS